MDTLPGQHNSMSGERSTRPIVLDAYRIATFPWRYLQLRKARREGTVPVAILFYHRVADTLPNPWTISTRGFESHLNWLSDHFELVSLQEAQRRIRSGRNSTPTVSITFDDGYADNSSHAVPLLIGRRIPFTYFVTTRNALAGEPFDHDVALNRPLLPNSIDAIRAMADAGVEIGGHTRSHPDLGKMTDPDQLFQEIVGAAREMENRIGKRIRYFAFPFGQPANFSAQAIAIARSHGMEGVCSAFGGWNEIGTDGFHLRRFHGDPVLARIRNWLTRDPWRQHAWDHPEVDRMFEEARNHRDAGASSIPPRSLTTGWQDPCCRT